MSRYDEIIAALPSLTARQLGEIQKRAGLLLKLQGAAAPAAGGSDQWILEGLMSAARELGHRVPPIGTIRRSTVYKSFAEFSEQVQARIEEKTPDLDKVSRQALGVLVGRALCNYMLKRNWEMTFDSMLKKVDVIPAAIEEAFPGYLESGLLQWLIRKDN